MSKELKQNIGNLARQIIETAMASGLTWDEAIAAMGVASKALAITATSNGDGPAGDCQVHAQKRFTEGFSQEVQIVFASSDLSQLKAAYVADPVAAEAVLANTNIRVIPKLH